MHENKPVGLGIITRITLLGLGVLLVCSGCVTDPARFDPLLRQQVERQSAKEYDTHEAHPLPLTLKSKYLDEKFQEPSMPTGAPIGVYPTVKLSLQDVLQRVVLNNPAIKVAAFNPGIEATREVEAQARFDPNFVWETQYQSQFADTAGSTFGDPDDPFTVLTARTDEAMNITTTASLQQIMPTGAQVQLSYGVTYTDNVPSRTFIDPFWENSITLSITQPLLRDFGYEVNQARIVVARNNQHISVLDLRTAIETQLAAAENIYWQLYQARRNLDIFERITKDTERTLEILRARIDRDVTDEQIAQAITSLEERRQSVVQAKRAIAQLSSQLRALMNDPRTPISSMVIIIPTTDPIQDSISFDVEEQIRTGLRHRAEISQQQIRVDSATVAATVAKNNLLPQFDIVGQVSNNGIESSYDQSFDRLINFNRISYGVGFRFEMPIGNRAARAIWARALLQRQQAIHQYDQLIAQIADEVTRAYIGVGATWDELVRARQARLAAKKALDLLIVREDGGEPLTPLFVEQKLGRQATLANAEAREAELISQYNRDILTLQQAKGMLMRYHNVEMREAPQVFGLETYNVRP